MKWVIIFNSIILFLGVFCAQSGAQTNNFTEFEVQLQGYSVQFTFRFREPVTVTADTPCFLNKLIFTTGVNLSDTQVNSFYPRFPGSCRVAVSSIVVVAELDPRDFPSALGNSIFLDIDHSFLTIQPGEEVHFLPSVNLSPIDSPLQASVLIIDIETPSMIEFDVDLNTSRILMHFTHTMILSSFDSTALTLVNPLSGMSYTLTSTSRPMGIEENFVGTICVTLSSSDVAVLQSRSICSSSFGGCSCYFTSSLATGYNDVEVQDVSPDAPLQVSKFRLPIPSERPHLYMWLSLSYIGCEVEYNLVTDEVYILRPVEYVTRIGCSASGERGNIWPTITFGVNQTFNQNIVQSNSSSRSSLLTISGGLPRSYFGLYTCKTRSTTIYHYIVNDSPFFGLPGGTGYSSRLFDSITIPFFFASSPKLDLMDPNIEIIFSPQPSGSPTPDPVYRKLSPFRGEVFYAEAPFSISESFTLTVISSDRSLRATSPDTIFINVDSPSVNITPSAIALLPNDTQVQLYCVTNNPRLPIIWVRNSFESSRVLSSKANYTLTIPSDGIDDETKYFCAVQDPENPSVGTDNRVAAAAAVITNIPEPLSVYRDGERIEDQAVFTTVNRLSRNITLRCLGHAPSNVIDIVWISEREGDEPVTLQPNENDNYTVVTYAYNEANLTISNALEPYRGTLRCQSLASGRQASFYVVESMSSLSQRCSGDNEDSVYGIIWPETRAGSRGSQPCPYLNGVETRGFAFRACDENGEWSSRVDVTNCKSAMFESIREDADERLSSFDSLTSEDQRNILNEIINNLKNATQPRTDGLFPQDLNISNNLLQSMIPRLMVDSLEEGILDVLDNMLDKSNRESWIQLSEITSGSRLLLINIEAFGRYFFQYQIQTDLLEMNLTKRNIFMKSERFSGTPSDVSFPEYSELRPGDGEVKVPASVFEEHNSIGIVNAIMENLQDFLPRPLPPDRNSTSEYQIASKVLSVQLMSDVTEYTSGVIQFNFTTSRLREASNPECVFRNTTSDRWERSGLVTSKVNEVESDVFSLRCESNHTTAFAIVVELVDEEEQTFELTIPLYIGSCAVSLSAVVSICILLLSCIPDPLKKYSLSFYFTHMSFMVSLICAFVTFLVGIVMALEDSIGCIATAALLHYFFTAAFSWLFCESLALTFFPFISRYCLSFLLLFILGWGLPAIPVAVSLFLLRDDYGSSFQCWFLFDGEFTMDIFIAFIIPKCAIIVLILIFLIASCVTTCVHESKLIKGQSRLHIHMLRLIWFGLLLLLLLLAGSWVFAVMHVNTYALDSTPTGLIFMGISIALAIWLFIFSFTVAIINQNVDYEMLWVTSGANQTMDRKNNRTKKSTQEYSLFAMTSVDARTELKTLDHDTLTSEIRIQEHSLPVQEGDEAYLVTNIEN